MATGNTYVFETATVANAQAFTSNDFLYFSQTKATDVSVTYNPASGFQIATVTLSAGSQTLTFAADQLGGASANGDLRFLAGGGELRIGTSGADTITTATATYNNNSALYALGGNDSILASGNGSNRFDLADGNDTFKIDTAAPQTSVSGNLLINGGAGSDTIDVTASHGHVTIFGNALGAVAGSADGNDLITLNHGALADTVSSVAAYSVYDYVNGNAGADTISVSSTGDTSYAATKNDVYHIYGGGDNDLIGGGYGINSINGQKGDDTIVGNGYNDWLRGGQGNDVVVGNGAGHFTDSVVSGSIVVPASTSQLFGDAGNDTIVAGKGVTVMQGDADGAAGTTGADVFIFSAGTAGTAHIDGSLTGDRLAGYTDEIRDFASGTDKIDLAQVVTGTSAANIVLNTTSTFGTVTDAYNYANTYLSTNAAPSASQHNILALQVGKDTYLFSHEAGSTPGAAAAADTVIKLDGVTASTLKSSDFV